MIAREVTFNSPSAGCPGRNASPVNSYKFPPCNKHALKRHLLTMADRSGALLLFMLLPYFALATPKCNDYSHLASSHVMCATPEPNCKIRRAGLSEAEKELIVDAHNAHRDLLARGFVKPLPPAADLTSLEWDDELAFIAQTQADQCNEDDACVPCRAVDRFQVGQLVRKIRNGDKKRNSKWDEIIRSWFEHLKTIPKTLIENFDPKQTNDSYAQVAWAKTNRIGCGFSVYDDDDEKNVTNLYICNYGPRGLKSGSRMYTSGKPCSKCQKNSKCSTVYGSLCRNSRQRPTRAIFQELTNLTDVLPTWFVAPLTYPELMVCSFDSDCQTKSIGTETWTLKNSSDRGNYYEVSVNRGGNAVLFILNGIPPSPTGSACLSFNYRKFTNALKSVSLKVFSWSLMGPPIETFVWSDAIKWTEWKTQIPDLKGYAIVIFHVSVPNDEAYHALTVSVDDIKITAGGCS